MGIFDRVQNGVLTSPLAAPSSGGGGGGGTPTGDPDTLAFFDSAGDLGSDTQAIFNNTLKSLSVFNGLFDTKVNSGEGNLLWLDTGGGGNANFTVSGSGNLVTGYLHGAGPSVTVTGNGNIAGGWIGSGATHLVQGGGNILWGWTEDAGGNGLQNQGAKGALTLGFSNGIQPIVTADEADGSLNGGHTGGGALSMGDGTEGFGVGSLQWGSGSTTTGQYAQTFGHGHNNSVYLCSAFGRFSTTIVTGSELAWTDSERLAVWGNGVDGDNRHDALTLLKDGTLIVSNTILPDEDDSWDLGSEDFHFTNGYFANFLYCFTVSNYFGPHNLHILTRNETTIDSFDIEIKTGSSDDADSGDLFLSTGPANSGTRGQVIVGADLRFDENQHLMATAPVTPLTITPNANAGAGATTPNIGITDLTGQIILNTGTGVATGVLLVVTLGRAFPNLFNVVLSPGNGRAADHANRYFAEQLSATEFQIVGTGTPLDDSVQYVFNYVLVGTYP